MDPNDQDQDRDEDLKPRSPSHMADARQPSNSESAGDHDQNGPAEALSTPGAEIFQTPHKQLPTEACIPITAPALSKLREGLEDPAGASRILTPSTSKLLEEAESLPKEPSAISKKPLSDPSTLGTVVSFIV